MEKNILQHILAGLQYLDDRLTRAKDSNHRCLFIIKSQNNNEQNLFLSRVIERLETKGILITKENRQKEFKKLYRAHSTLNRKINTFNHVTRLLGTTIGYAIIDCREQLEPNSLSIICESVQGGGIIIILFPDNMKQIKTYRTSNCSNSFVESRYHFLQWFHSITEKMSECHIINLNSGSISGIKATPRPRKLEKRKIPSNIKIDSRIYGLARTNDQIKAIKTMESLLTSHKQKNYRNVVVFRSSRGRGKSAAMGLGLVGLAQYLWKKEQRFIKIGIIAPYLENASTTLCFAEKGLTILNGSSRIERIKKNKGFKSNFASIEFYHLREVISQELDLLGVDEAAGIPPFYLKTFLKRFPKVIYATTTAGYEGTGRAFSVRFLHSIKNQKEYQTQQLELFEPIRYSKHDPVEQWLYRVLLLDAKPSKLTKEEINQFTISHPLSLREFTAEELFQQKNETLLRELMGIFVLAHYRNQPNDLALMADNPHYRIFGVMGEKGKIIAAIQIATEGKLNDHQKKQIDHGKDLDGHLIPVAGIKYLNLEFASLFGLRIIRIAVHPKLFRKGIGSLALQTLEKQTHNEGIDWIGAAFGASKSLVNFWNSSNYSAINIRPSKLSSTGEHSLIVTKGISEEAKLTIEIGSRDFLLRFIDWLGVTLYDMEPDLALSIIEACPPNREFVPRITTTGVMRLQRYIWKQFYLLMVVDVVKELAWWYFTYKPQDVQLSESQKLLLLSLGVQGRNWGQTISHIHLPWEDVQGLLRNAVKKLLRTFLQTKDEGANSVP